MILHIPQAYPTNGPAPTNESLVVLEAVETLDGGSRTEIALKLSSTCSVDSASVG
jgi:hypothetical protein